MRSPMSRRRFVANAAAVSLTAVVPRGLLGASSSTRKVEVRADAEIGVVRPEFHGHFAEHLGSCVYGGLWVGRNSSIPNIDGYRRDAVQYLKELGVPVLRWPGGCFADDYHWRDGIGPAGQRPKRVNIHWGGYVEDNSFGTHEFIGLCRLLGAEPYLAGNVGSGSPHELRDWIEYCNMPSSSTLAEERAKNGSSEPFRVRYWGVGNENWGCGGRMRPEVYADHYRQFSVYIREFGGTKPFLVASGPNGNDTRWTRGFMDTVQGGKQVAVLVPTTILAEQHGRTFRERLADYPVRIEVLSRFRGTRETAPLVQRIAGGDVDIVIGTHRLLSADVTFKDLGLLIVDEEHRFGVRHKERLKALKLSVDVLTLTATPIPRTLHLSLAGLRDLTLLETAPKDRSPVLTFVEPWDDPLLEEAMARELDRGGQVYFVHNRIETIDTVAARVRALAPRARLAVAHGQMRETDLEAVMGQFVRGEVDILVSTMIVESGLDVPNANTMIVDRADRFGLAQLYQLRGRVGRSHRRAFCYLLVPDQVDAQAEERLQVLEHHTDLGSGYRIALRDLELRGAGNLLGGEQSGHVQAVGFDMYLRWLEETVRGLKAGDGGRGMMKEWTPPDVTLDAPAHLPDEYVADDDAKLNLYRRLARAEQPGEI